MITLVSVLAVVAAADSLAATESSPALLTLDQALEIALSENVSVKVADKEIERTEYARKGSYAALFPTLDGSASFQRTIKKQVMYMDFDMSAITGGAGGAGGTGGEGSTGVTGGASASSSESSGGMEIGRWNSFSTGVSAGMPLVNFQLWESLRISGQDVDLAVEKARSSRLDMVTQVKQAYFGVLLAKNVHEVYKSVYENALANFERIKMRREAQKASELEYARAATTLANAVPNVYDSANSIALALWRLKAIMGIDLDEDIDTVGSLYDYSTEMSSLYADEDLTLDNNSTMRQLAIQAEQIASSVRAQKYASLPSLSLSFSYMYNAMANDFEFKNYNWTPYSFVGLNLSIPIFAGGKRYHAVKAAAVQADELDMQIRNTERQLKISIRQNINSMDTAIHSFEAADTALEAARKSFDITQASYEVGSSTLTDLNDAQLALVQAQLSVNQSIYNYLSAKASLEGLLGNDFLAEEN